MTAMRWWLTGLAASLVVLQYVLWMGRDGILDLHYLRRAVQAAGEENEKLRARNESLTAEVADLKQGLDAVEERARSELGMIKPGETFYRVIEEPRPPR